jgi:hypothetical protein
LQLLNAGAAQAPAFPLPVQAAALAIGRTVNALAAERSR